MKPIFRMFHPFWYLCLLLGAVATVSIVFHYAHSSARGLPYRDSFHNNAAAEWTPFGGSWEVERGTMRNDSDERGAKLVTGSPSWSNYTLEGDVQLLGELGDAGLMVRSRDEEEGVDAYSGYYAGLHSPDNILVLGRADHGWVELASAPLPGSLKTSGWYHLRVEAFGCHIAALATQLTTGNSSSVGFDDPDCIPSGRIGLRSHWAGGIWRNIVVNPIFSSTIQATRTIPTVLQNPMPQTLQRSTAQASAEPIGAAASLSAEGEKPSKPSTIRSLQLMTDNTPKEATVRGIVTHSAPRLYVQDETGGIAVVPNVPGRFELGDELEVRGRVEQGSYSSIIRDASIRTLWVQAPIPPTSITADQAATGAFDAMFVEVDGYLANKEAGADGTYTLDLDYDHQSFRAIMRPGRNSLIFPKLLKHSLLRMRGICVVDPSYTHNTTPFVLLLGSTEDIKIIAGPPWYSFRYLIFIVMAFLVCILAAYLLYLRVQHWRFRAVSMERERLAHEMHDTLAQSFAGIGFQLQAIRNRVHSGDRNLEQSLDIACDLARKSHDEARLTISSLQPEFLETGGLDTVLRKGAQHLVEGGDIMVDAVSIGDDENIPLKLKDTLYRIGQEAIANSVRHARPRHLNICVEYKRTSVRLTVEDDGVGFISSGKSSGFGVTGMRKRAESIAASFEIDSEPGRGTRVSVIAPLESGLMLRYFPYRTRHGRKNGRITRKDDPYSYRG